MSPVFRPAEYVVIFRNQPFPWITDKGEFEITLKDGGRHAPPGRENVVVGAEKMFLIVPLQPGAAFEVSQPAGRRRQAQGPQHRLHTGAGDLAHLYENEFVAV